eukprot:5793128-Amphidinium_carterae.1
MEAHLSSHRKKLLNTDPTFTIELGLLQTLVDGGCSRRVQEIVLDALPNQMREVSITESQAQIEETVNSALCTWADASTQAS